MTTAERKLLVLDLDETLLHACKTPLDRSPDFVVGPYHVYKRPFVDEFLLQVRSWFRVAVWTSASPAYARAIVDSLFQDPAELAFVWAADRCTMAFDPHTSEHHATKKLHKLKRKGYPLEHVIVVDDSPEKHRTAYGNLIHVRPYTGDVADHELRSLIAYLERLRTVANVRAIEKRSWRSQVDWQSS